MLIISKDTYMSSKTSVKYTKYCENTQKWAFPFFNVFSKTRVFYSHFLIHVTFEGIDIVSIDKN